MIDLNRESLFEVAENIKKYESKLAAIFGKKVTLHIVELEDDVEERNVFSEFLFMKKVIEVTATQGCVSQNDLCSKSREDHLVELRAIAYTIIKENYPKASLQSIGKMFSGRDHATVSHGLDIFKDKWQDDKSFRNKYITIRNIIKKQNEHTN
jgi:chromosomal replication initiation ATPase DnaA